MSFNESPLVSVIIPSYNAENFIEQTINSVLKQTYQNFEILVIDDASKDGTKSIVEKLSLNQNRIKFFEVEHTGRPAVLRNLGIKKSRGKYIAFLDSDDIWLEHKLQEQIKLIEAKKNISFVYSVSKTFGDVNIFSEKYEILPLPFKAAHNKNELLKKGNPVTCSTVIAAKQLILQAGGFDESSDLAFVEDYDLWIKLSGFGPVGFIPKIHTLYRVHGAQSSNTWNVKSDRLAKLSNQKNLNLPEYKFYRNKGFVFLAARNIIHLISYFIYTAFGGFFYNRLIKQK